MMTVFLSLLAQLNRFTKEIQDPYNNATDATIVDTSGINGNPIRDGAQVVADGIQGIKVDGINSFDDAKNSILISIQYWVNRLMGFLALIALVYLIIQGIQLLINPKDDEVKKIWTRISTAIWALGGIGLAWLFVSFVFYVVKIITYGQ